jgi:hypothetical protein
MSKVVYGMFRDEPAAAQALDRIHANARYREIDAVVHEGYVREEDVQLGGTRALSGMIVGGLVVGVIGAIAASFFVWPMAGYWFGFTEAMLVLLAGSTFGVIAGGVAGASECKPSIRDGAHQVAAKGRVMVTAELDDADDVAAVVELLRDGGASEVRAA